MNLYVKNEYVKNEFKNSGKSVSLTIEGVVDVAETTQHGAIYQPLWKWGGVYMNDHHIHFNLVLYV